MCVMQVLMDYEAADLALLAEVFTGVANGRRLAILFGLDTGMSMPEVADLLGVERGALQRHIDILVRSELVFRPSDLRAYALTALGGFVIDLVDDSAEEVLQQLSKLEDVRIDLEEEIPEYVDNRDSVIHTESWERVTQNK